MDRLDASCGIMGFANAEGLPLLVISHTWDHIPDGLSNICAVPATSGILTGTMAQGSAGREILKLQPLLLVPNFL